MRFRGVICGLLLALPLPGAAQTMPAPPRSVRDSAYAVHQLFRNHRTAAEGAFATGAVGVVGLVLGATQDKHELISINALIMTVSTVVGLRQATRYSPDRERLIVREYEQGWPLPAEVRRRLKRKHFRAR